MIFCYITFFEEPFNSRHQEKNERSRPTKEKYIMISVYKDTWTEWLHTDKKNSRTKSAVHRLN